MEFCLLYLQTFSVVLLAIGLLASSQVYRHSLQKDFPLQFIIHLNNGTTAPVGVPLQIEELNNRTDYTVIGRSI